MFTIEVKDLRNKLPTHSFNKYEKRTLAQILSIALHHAAVNGGNAFQYGKYHVSSKKWPGIGYHFVILPDGTIEWCHDLETISYHVGNSNHEAIGICFAGNFDVSVPTQAQLDSCYKLIDELNNIVGRKLKVKGHTEYPDYEWKTCPGKLFNLSQFKKNLNEWKGERILDKEVQARLAKIEKHLFGEVYKAPMGKYEKIRFMKHTDVHIYRSSKRPELVLGTWCKKEKLDNIAKMYQAKVAINCGYFAMGDNPSEHIGLLVTDNGADEEVKSFYQASRKDFPDVVAWKNGKVTVEQHDGFDGDYLSKVQYNAFWGFGTVYPLIIEGKKNTLNWGAHRSLTNQRANRTMIGQDKQGIWYLIVNDGRTTWDIGLTSKEQVELGLQLNLEWLVNLDGGGSSDMYLDGKIVTGNYKTERAIGTAFIIR